MLAFFLDGYFQAGKMLVWRPNNQPPRIFYIIRKYFPHGLSMKMPPFSPMARQMTASIVSVLPKTGISEV
jgi:hypothetical protein